MDRASSRVQPSPRAARKSEWLRSALAHHHCPDPSAENEIVVLATGIDQYLQEVFHHLAYPNRNDTLTAEDFLTLCAVLGLSGADKRKRSEQEGPEGGREREEDEEFLDVCSELPGQLSFKDFHSRLCGYFRVRSARKGAEACAWRLPVTEDTELLERQIRLRWPRVRRRKCVSFDLTKNQNKPDSSLAKSRTAENPEPDEVLALRELVEDLRSALQGSDARCLALEVALRRARSHNLPNYPTSSLNATFPTHISNTSLTFSNGKLVPTQTIRGQRSPSVGECARKVPRRRRDTRDPLVRELKLIRASRDGQLEEAIKFNERLEEELRWAYQEVHKLQGLESALRRENTLIRRRAEEAREALRLGLEKVRMIQEQAESVPQFQSRISQLESELHQYRCLRSFSTLTTLRSRCTCLPDSAHQLELSGDSSGKTDVECLQRAVEGRASSDEEEEEEEGGLRNEGLSEMRSISRAHSCEKGCQNRLVHPPGRHDNKRCCSWNGQTTEQPEGSRMIEKGKSEEDKDVIVVKDKGKARLSLLEEKISDALSLLLQLRNQNVPRGTLGKIVMETLDVRRRSRDDSTQVLQVADALCAHLSSEDLGQNTGKEREEKSAVSSPSCQTSASPLVISC